MRRPIGRRPLGLISQFGLGFDAIEKRGLFRTDVSLRVKSTGRKLRAAEQCLEVQEGV